MPLRWLLALAAIGTLLIASTLGASAKTIVSSSDVPDNITEKEPFTVSMTLEDHDSLFTSDANLVIIAREVGSTEELEFAATPGSDPLHWSAELALPEPGTWALYVSEPTLGFRFELDSVSVAEDPAAGITGAELNAAITSATDPLTKQIGSLTGEMKTLQTDVATLTAERDALQKQLATLQNAPEPTTSAETPLWQASIAGALAALAVAVLGYIVATHRPRLRREEPTPAMS